MTEGRLRTRQAESLVRPFLRDLRLYYRAQRERVLTALQSLPEPTYETITESEADDIMSAIFDTEAETEKLAKIFADHAEGAMDLGWEAAERKLKLLLYGYDVPAIPARHYLMEHPIEFGKKWAPLVTHTQNVSIRSAIERGLFEREGIPKIMKRIKKAYEEVSRFRAEVIARTETNRAYNHSKLHRYAEEGVTGKRWFWGGGEVCPTLVCHYNAAQGVIPLRGAFQSGHQAPPAHPNCTCDLIVDEDCFGGQIPPTKPPIVSPPKPRRPKVVPPKPPKPSVAKKPTPKDLKKKWQNKTAEEMPIVGASKKQEKWAREWMAKVPEEYLQGVEEVTFCRTAKQWSIALGKAGNMSPAQAAKLWKEAGLTFKGCWGSYWIPPGGKGHVFLHIHPEGHFMSASNYPKTMIHEFGHNVHFNVHKNTPGWFGEPPEQVVNIWKRTRRDLSKAFITDSAGSHPREMFSDCFGWYIQNPAKLMNTHPDMYKWLKKNVFHGREYLGAT